MVKAGRQYRWAVSLVIAIVVLAISVLVILTNRAPPYERIVLKAVSDGAGGAMVAWQDKQVVHVQRINSEGKLLWASEGILEATTSMHP